MYKKDVSDGTRLYMEDDGGNKLYLRVIDADTNDPKLVTATEAYVNTVSEVLLVCMHNINIEIMT